MAVELGTAYVSIVPETSKVKSGLDKAFGEASNSVAKAGDQAGAKWGSSFNDKTVSILKKGMKVGMASAGVAAAGAFGQAMAGGFKRLDAIEQASAKFDALGYSAQESAGIINDVTAAVKGTAFSTSEAADAAAMALAAGIKPGEELTGVLQTIGDTASFSNKEFGEIAPVFTKIMASGKMTGATLTQLNENGVPALSALQNAMGKTAEEIQDMASKGEISFDDLKSALDGAIGGQALKAGDTFSGSLKNMRAALSRLGETMLSTPFTMGPKLFSSIGDSVDGMNSKFKVSMEYLQNGFSDGASLEGFKEAFGSHADQIVASLDRMKSRMEAFSAGFNGEGGAGAFGNLGRLIGSLADSIQKALPHVLQITASLGQAGLTASVVSLSGVLQALTPVLTAVLVPALEILATLMQENQWAVTALVTAFAGFHTLKFITAGLDAMKTGLMASTGAMKIFNVVMAMNPIGLLVTALSAVVVGLGLFLTKTEAGRNAMQAFGNVVSTVVQSIGSVFQWFGDIFSSVFEWFGNVISSACETIQVLAEIVASAIGTVIAPHLETFRDIVGFVGDAWNILRDKVAEVVGAVSGKIDEMVGVIKSVPDTIKGFFSNAGQWLIDAGKNVIKGLIDGIKSMVGSVGDAIKSVVPSFAHGAIPFADGGIAAYAQGGISQLERFANGTSENHTAQIAKAGEWRLWAEQETGGEAYIPLAQSKRSRSTAILAEVARRFGLNLTDNDGSDISTNTPGGTGPVSGAVQAFADGGIRTAAELRSFVSGQTVDGVGATRSLEGAMYDWGGVNWGDCSGAMSAIARFMVGLAPFAGRFATMSMAQELLNMGFNMGKGPQGSLRFGWFNGGPYGGHTGGTLPDGTNVEMGGGRGNGQIGGAAAGADDPQFTDHAWLDPKKAAAPTVSETDPTDPTGVTTATAGTGTPDDTMGLDSDGDPNLVPLSADTEDLVAEIDTPIYDTSTGEASDGGPQSWSEAAGDIVGGIISGQISDILNVFGIKDEIPPIVLAGRQMFVQAQENMSMDDQDKSVYDAALARFEAEEALRKGWGEEGEESDSDTSRFDELAKAGEAAGLTDEQIKVLYAAQLAGTEKTNDELISEIQGLDSTLSRAEQVRQISGSEGQQDVAPLLAQSDTDFEAWRKTLPSFATGGKVSGGKGKNKDDVLANLSDDEMVMNSEAVEGNEQLLEIMNAGGAQANMIAEMGSSLVSGIDPTSVKGFYDTTAGKLPGLAGQGARTAVNAGGDAVRMGMKGGKAATKAGIGAAQTWGQGALAGLSASAAPLNAVAPGLGNAISAGAGAAGIGLDLAAEGADVVADLGFGLAEQASYAIEQPIADYAASVAQGTTGAVVEAGGGVLDMTTAQFNNPMLNAVQSMGQQQAANAKAIQESMQRGWDKGAQSPTSFTFIANDKAEMFSDFRREEAKRAMVGAR